MREIEKIVFMIDEIAVYMAGFGFLFVIIVSMMQFIKKHKKKRLAELKKAKLKKADGIIFGGNGRKVVYSPAFSSGHVLSCAATGMGKTTTAVTSLREWGRIKPADKGKVKRTMYCIDISGDIEKNCPDVVNKLVCEPLPELPEPPESLLAIDVACGVTNMDLESAEDVLRGILTEEEFQRVETDLVWYVEEMRRIIGNIVPYNIFGTVDQLKTKEEKNTALEQLAILLMPEKPNMNDNARFFLLNGRKILLSALIAYYHAGLDFTEICDKILQNSFQKLFEDIDQQNNKEASVLLNGFYMANETNTAGCLQQCQDAISVFGRIDLLKESLRRPKQGEMAIEPKMLETHNIFLKIPEDRLEMLAPLMRLISADIMNYITVRKTTEESPMVLLYWDEFGSLNLDADTVVLPGLRRARKRRCRIWVLCQNISDFNVLYGEAVTRSMLSNFKYKLLLGGLGEPESQKYFAELIGYRKSVKKSVTKGSQSMSETESEQREYIIEPADLDKQGKEWAILIASEEGQGYLRLKKKPYYKC